MRIRRVEVTNIKGIAKLEFQPRTVTIIRGRNGSGKSSILDAISAVFAGGNDPGWLRKGAKKGQIRIEVEEDNGQLFCTIEKTIGTKQPTVEVLDACGHVVPAPQTYIKQLGDAIAVDPSRILAIDASTAAGRKQLTALLLELMPIEFTAAELSSACVNADVWDALASFLEPDALDLNGLAKVRKQIEETRRRVGQEARDSEGTVNDLKRSLPEQDGTDWTAEVWRLDAARDAATKQESETIAGIQHDARVEREALEDDFAKAEREIRAEMQAKLDALVAEKEKLKALHNKLEAEAIAQVKQTGAPERERLTAEIATAKERLAQQHKAQAIHESIEKFTAKCREKNGLYDRLSRALEAIDSAKKAKLESLPVEGVEFAGDTALIDGVEWQHANTARRVMVACQLSSLRAGNLPFVVLDDAEHLDSETKQALIDGLTEAGFQVALAEVDDTDLTILSPASATADQPAE